MPEKLWDFDGVSVTFPYAIAKIIANRDHPHREEVLNRVSAEIEEMVNEGSWFEQLHDPKPMAKILEGMLKDGADMSYGPVIYLRKIHMNQVEASFNVLREAANTNAKHESDD
jgi:hypothetical protein